MSDGSNLIYVYDGSFDGLLCCVFESYERREVPTEIIAESDLQPSLFRKVLIDTDFSHSARLRRAIPQKICPQAYEYVWKGYLSCHPQKEMLVLKFLYMGFKYGARVMTMLADDAVNELFKVVQHLGNEAHLYTGFVRFSDCGGVLIAEIEPQNSVLPIIMHHFCERFRNETFMIYDRTHFMALVYSKGRSEIVPIEELVVPPPDDTEIMYRRLWKTFYDTIAIKERENPRCRMTHMPKHYWACMTEMKDELSDSWLLSGGNRA